MDDWQQPPPAGIPLEEGRLRFCDLELPAVVYRGICELGFQYCTPIQQQCLPHVLAGQDVAGRAQTGTGKTAAFLIGAITRFVGDPKPDRPNGSVRMLVLAPTRELAIQIHRDAEALGKYADVRARVVFGGMDREKQRRNLRGPVDILVGTPGRVIDFTRSRDLDFSHTEVLVLDEADRMLDMGFIPDVRRIVGRLPATGKRQSALFSATLEDRILRLARAFLHDPVRVEVDPENLVTDLVEQVFYSVPEKDKLALLLWLLKHEPVQRMLIFGNRRDTTRRLHNRLRRYGIHCAVMSGDIEQRKRLRLLEQFRAGEVPVIIATEVAARGLHVDDISHVVNYDMPFEPEMYVHRIGRTGRAGAKGKSISFICEFGGYLMMDLEEYLGDAIHTSTPAAEMLVMPELPAGAAPDTCDDDEDDRRDRRGPRRGPSRRGGGRRQGSGRRPRGRR